ncbi:hypothetical protein LJ725_27135 [Reyranella aquatilis]|uniref:Ig-like domain-containing protein n=1 Tax=Reyranella aquatilis TaxID=2035356 RepID=A0ABS8L478_9HYPH|nr:hypothetical protein [Reyranella aquatilis]MCC8432663.1 hypothetical protein [Reyranella aquatilis]
MIARLTCLAILLLSSMALAQATGEAPKVCTGVGLSGFDYKEYQATEWPEEARRIEADVPSVARRGDRLRLAIDGGKSIELQDCLNGDGSYGYLYERFDDPGRFYVVRTPAYEDFYYTLVMRRTGRLFTVHGAPVWASDKTRFLTVACSLQPPRGTLSIFTPSGDGLATEAEVELPCATESCSARWDFESWISVACTPRDDTAKKGREFVLMRGRDGKWNRFGR